MNGKIAANIAFMVILTIILVFLGKLFVISPMDTKIDNKMQDLTSLRTEIANYKVQLAALPEKSATPQEKISLLSVGEEGQLMKLFLDKILEKGFKINTYDLFSSYHYKSEVSDQDNNMPVQETAQPEALAQLDENGMPLNAYVEADEVEWPGVEVTPLKITFTARAEGMNTALKYFWNLPANTIRAADFILDGNIIKGTMIFAFPMNE